MAKSAFEKAKEKFIKKYMQPPYNVNAVGTSRDKNKNPVIKYHLSKPLDEGLEIPDEFMGIKTQLSGIGTSVAY